MSETGDKLTAAYRALPREEPGTALDAAILAASRRALAKPSASRRWAAPISIAAVLVLAFGVTLHMQREQPGVESPEVYTAPAPATRPQPPAPQPPPTARTQEMTPEPPPPKPQALQARPEKKPVAAAKRDEAPKAKLEAKPQANEMRAEESERRDAADALAKDANVQKEANLRQAPASAPDMPAAPPARASAAASAAAPAQRAGIAADAQGAIDEPTRELEAIAKLRAESHTEEADKALAEFRRKRPDYRIPDAMWERVKPR
jgi:hypothetical protein